MSDWQPKVGEECLVKHNGEWHKTFIVGISSQGRYVYESDEFSGTMYDGNNITCFKPLPTEEEKLIDSMCDIFEEAACKQMYSMKNGMKALIKAGYRKVEPISYDDLVEVCIAKSPAYVCEYLIKNNHIVVKGE